MEYHVVRNELLRELQLMQGVIEKKNTMPILANIYIKAENNQLILQATDLEIGIITVTSAQVVEPGEFTVNAKQLQDMLNAFSDAQVTFSLNEGTMLDLSCGSARFSIETMPTQDYPSIPECDFENATEMQIGFVEKCLAKVFFSVSSDPHKYALNGAMFKLENNFFQLVSTDGHRMSVVSKELEHVSGNYEMIIPRKTLAELNKSLKVEPEDDPFKLEVKDNRVFFQIGPRTLFSRLVDGKFPDYGKAIPQDNNLKFDFDRTLLLNIVKRKVVLSTEKSKLVRLSFKPGEVVVVLRSPERGESVDRMGIEYDGESLDVGFNVDYLLDFLKNMNTPGVELYLRDESSQGLFRLAGDETGVDYKHVIMPMRLT
jgi:DNA polymerase-3 subunit beta